MVKKLAEAANFGVPTTTALVYCVNWAFVDIDGAPESETIGCEFYVTFNGMMGDSGGRIAVPRNATLATKQAAVRTKVNELLQTEEPGVTLNNANIQITGIPV